jgi:MYXO-CTERM domain-containing protein
MAIGLAAMLPALAIHPAPARACGGFFCDQPGGLLGSQPIAQTGENVLFRVDPAAPAGTSIEAHIQIFYSGPAAQFSWILPVDAAPTLDTGSDSVFTIVSGKTNPSFQVTTTVEGTCRQTTYPPGGGYGGAAAGAGGSTGAVDAGTSVTVVFQGGVGPYDAAVIHGPDATDIEAWLSTNGYYVSDQAKSIIETYVSENKYFVALKLMGDQSTSAIRPIILRFDAQSPCIPLRLTAIASVSNLRVNAWILAPKRTVPQNYYEITLNLARLNWFGGGSNYADLLTQAATEAGGNAFITEYAGTARIMDGAIWSASRVNLDALRAATTPPAYMAALMQQSVPRDTSLLKFLEKYIPEPTSLVASNVSETAFYNQLAYYYSQNPAGFAPFDSVAATDGFQSMIVAPLQEAQTLFDNSPYLTRLATFISPPQMTKDPLFLFNSDIGDVSNVHAAQGVYECGDQQYSICDAPIRLTLPDGNVERLTAAPSTYCTYQTTRTLAPAVAALPALATAWQRRDVGTGVVVADNTLVIATTLAAASAVTPGNGPAGVGGSFGAGGSMGAGGMSGAGGSMILHSTTGGGCGCAVADSGGPALAGFLPAVFGALLLVRRRRRAR